MANKSRFYIAESSIKAFFKESLDTIYKAEHLSDILEKKRMTWNLPAYMTAERFIQKMLDNGILEKKEIEFDGYLNTKVLFLAGEVSVYQVATALINRSYLSHYSAAYLHGLTLQVPKTIYISFEQTKKGPDGNLGQKGIDAAFSKPQRKSTTSAKYEGYTFLIHNGMYSNRAGVNIFDDLPVTNLERTLIDIAVRPNYAGGVASVLDIYKIAAPNISINKLVAILDKLNFIYPYHQAIGFYLEKAGAESKKLDVLRAREKLFDFYLTYEMEQKVYDPNWRLYYPKGL